MYANFYSRGRCSHKIFVLAYFVLKSHVCFFVNHNHNRYRTAGYCCEVQIFATLLKWPLAEIFAIAKFARKEADFHWILCQENAWAKFLRTRKYKNFSLPASRNFCESNLYSQISQKFGPRTHNPLYGIRKNCNLQAIGII